MISKKSLVTGFLAVVLTLCLAAAAFAAPEVPFQQDSPVPGAAPQAEQIAGLAFVVEEAGEISPEGGWDCLANNLANNKDKNDEQKVPGSGQTVSFIPAVIGQASSGESPEWALSVAAGEYPVLGVEGASPSAEELQMLNLINQERAAAGALQLKTDPSNYDRAGIGIVVSGGYRYCVQLFTGGQRKTVPTTDNPGGSGNQPQKPSQPGQAELPGLSPDEALMVQLINRERANAGLPGLVPDDLLFKVARLKAKDFVENNYFSHTSSTYGTLRNMLNSFGVKYTYAGENLALSSSASRAHNALMGSPGNKANILGSEYQRVGIGVAVQGSSKYFVQIYTGGSASKPSYGGQPQPPAGDPAKPPATGTNPGQSDPGASGLTADETRMLNLVNAERAKYGLAPLKANLKLTGVARLKAKDMIDKNYFSHTSPTYGSPFDMMRQFGITYRTAGENLAGAPAVDTAHTNLMNSPGHRANILNGSFKEVGIGILNGSRYGKIFVQMFIG